MKEFNIEKFISDEFDVRMSGNNIYFNCPFCETDKGYNYWFRPDKEYVHKKTGKKYSGVGRCFKCEKSHNVISFLMEYKKLSIQEAITMVNGEGYVISSSEILSLIDDMEYKKKDNVDKLYNDFNNGIKVELPPGCTSRLPDELVDWFVNTRGFSEDLIPLLGIKYCRNSELLPNQEFHGMKLITLRNRAIFPVKTFKNIGWQAYLYKQGFNSRGDKFPKTRNPPLPVMHALMFLYEYSKNSETIIVNEGIFDSLRVMSRGYSPVALFGKNISFDQAHILSLSKAREIVMCLDGGKKEWIQTIKNCQKLEDFYDGKITMMKLKEGYDPDDISQKYFDRSFRERIQFENKKILFDSQRKIIGYNEF